MELSNEEAVKWLCFFECIHEITQYCDNNGLDATQILNKKAKLSHIRNYIQERYHTMSTDIELGRLNKFSHDFIYGDT